MTPARKLYLDNIRWMTVVLVVIYHVVYMFNGVQPFGVIGPFREHQLQDCFQYLVYPWFMALLFVVSGMSARYYLQSHTTKQFVKDKTRKLLVPSTIGLFVFQWLLGILLTLLIYTSGEELSNRAWWARTLLHAILLEAALLPLAHNWGFWYNTLDGLIYGTFILTAKVMWHLIDFGQSFYMAAALNEQIRKRKREEIQKEGSNNG